MKSVHTCINTATTIGLTPPPACKACHEYYSSGLVNSGHALAHLYGAQIQVIGLSARSASSPPAGCSGSGGEQPPAFLQK